MFDTVDLGYSQLEDSCILAHYLPIKTDSERRYIVGIVCMHALELTELGDDRAGVLRQQAVDLLELRLVLYICMNEIRVQIFVRREALAVLTHYASG